MLTSRIFSYVALGVTALIGATQASPIANGLQPRAGTPEAALSILKTWSANVNATVPKLVSLGRAGQDTKPAFDTLYKLYDQVAADLGRLPPDDSTKEAPIHHEIAKTISGTFTSVNTAVNNLKGTQANVDNAKVLAAREQGIKVKVEVTVKIGWSLVRGLYAYVEIKLTVVYKRIVSGLHEARAIVDGLANLVVKKERE
ncbi:hypothetical protein FRC03_003037 [Tulasnella sp. 419]|nr:hypothetical protein FRC03_003037 [Tulasnella sp. 419]